MFDIKFQILKLNVYLVMNKSLMHFQLLDHLLKKKIVISIDILEMKYKLQHVVTIILMFDGDINISLYFASSYESSFDLMDLKESYVKICLTLFERDY